MWNKLLKFRVCNIKLPIEVGRFTNLPRHERTCHICNKDQLGDEFHFLFECSNHRLTLLRSKYLNVEFRKDINVLKFDNLMNSKDFVTVRRLAKFIKEGLTVFD